MSGRGSVALVVRSEIRGRGRSLVALALIVALVSGVFLTAVTGARRTESAFDRFRDDSRASDLWVQVDDADAALEVAAAIRTLPMVADAAGWVITPGVPADAPPNTPDFALVSDPGGRYGDEVDRPRMVDGRVPAPDATDEVFLSETAAKVYGLRTGDRLEVQTFSPEDLEAIVEGDFLGFNGPAVDLTVVGVGQWPEELAGGVQNSVLLGMVSPSFATTYAATVGSWPITNRVRLAEGRGSVSELTETVREIAGPGVDIIVDRVEDDHLTAVRDATSVLALAALVLGIICGIAGTLIVGQAISRQLGLSSRTIRTLGALGLSTNERVAALMGPATLAVLGGLVLGAAASIAASPLHPIGVARRAEPDPGIWVDPLVLGVGSLALLAVLGCWALLSARRAVRLASSDPVASRRGSWVANRLARWGGRPVATTGVRFAYETGAGRTAVPVRTAIAGGALGVSGVIAVAVVAVSLTTLAGSPERWGWTWSSRPDMEGDVEETLALLANDSRIDAVAGLSYATVEVGDQQVQGYAVESRKGSVNLSYLSGRAPTGPNEVALGQRTLRALGKEIGDTVEAPSADRSETMTFEIVGVATTPAVEATDPAQGAVFQVDALDAVRQSDGSQQLLLNYDESVIDVAALEADLAETADLAFPVYARPSPPNGIANLQQIQGTTVVVAGFFALLGAVGVAHALAMSVRRRRSDLGVLRVLGFDRSQVHGTIGWQAVTIAATSVVLGIPAGIVVGRAMWRWMSGDLGVLADPSQPWVVLLAVGPLSVLLALCLAALPALRAGRLSPAAALRSE